MRFSLVILIFLLLLLFVVSCTNNSTLICDEGFVLEDKSCVSSTSCGNQRCELGEDNTFCPYDCEKECIGICNNQVQVYCEPNCSEQEPLMKYYAEMQKNVVTCLEQYFGEEVPRVNYKIIPDVTQKTCVDPDGCCCTEGGLTSAYEIRHINFNGFIPYNYKYPQTGDQLLPDEHETTHYFLYHLISDHPLWFSEAVAIQTNERIQCAEKGVSNGHPGAKIVRHLHKGDAYLRERRMDIISNGGIIMSDGTVLNEDFYNRLKSGSAELSENEKNEAHVRGTIWIIGLKVEYNCESDCLQKIIAQLHQKCKITACTQTTTQDIKTATDRVIGVDTKNLFDLLKIS